MTRGNNKYLNTLNPTNCYDYYYSNDEDGEGLVQCLYFRTFTPKVSEISSLGSTAT